MANKKGKKTNNNNTIANTKAPEVAEVIEAPEVIKTPEVVEAPEVVETPEVVEVIETSKVVKEEYVDNCYTAKELIEEAQKLIDSNHPFIWLITRLLEEVKTKLD